MTFPVENNTCTEAETKNKQLESIESINNSEDTPSKFAPRKHIVTLISPSMPFLIKEYNNGNITVKKHFNDLLKKYNKDDAYLTKFDDFITTNIDKPKTRNKKTVVKNGEPRKNESSSYDFNQKKLLKLLGNDSEMGKFFTDAFTIFLIKDIFTKYLEQSKIKKNKDNYLNNIEAFKKWIDKLKEKL